jgi:hypothetical protein
MMTAVAAIQPVRPCVVGILLKPCQVPFASTLHSNSTACNRPTWRWPCTGREEYCIHGIYLPAASRSCTQPNLSRDEGKTKLGRRSQDDDQRGEQTMENNATPHLAVCGARWAHPLVFTSRKSRPSFTDRTMQRPLCERRWTHTIHRACWPRMSTPWQRSLIRRRV